MNTKRPRGTGSVYRRGRIWWYSFVRDGALQRESSNSPLKTVAQARLDAAIKAADSGFSKSRLSVADLMRSALSEYDRQGRASAPDAAERWKLHLAPAFGSVSASRVTSDRLRDYANKRVMEGAAKATVNRELALLRFAFNLARKERKLQFIPWFPMFDEKDNVRTGFLEDADYDKLAAACARRGLSLRTMFEIAFQFGWRSGEIKTMRARQVDLSLRILRLDPGATKNGEGREAIMPPTLFALVQQCMTGKQSQDALFDTTNFRKAWESACTEAGVPDLLFHDLRRTAVRNMIRRGIDRVTAKKISGHLTDSVFDRYRIVDHQDLKDAALKMAKPAASLTIDAQSEGSSETVKPN